MFLLLLPLFISPLFYFAFSDWWQFGFFVIGMLIGIALLFFDETIGYRYYAEGKERVQLITRSPLFVVTLLPMTLFVITSSGSSLGMGLVLALGMVICTELLWWQKNPLFIHDRFYVDSAKELTITEISWITSFLVGFFGFMSFHIFMFF